jgi:antagonist of KipI
VTLAVHKPGLLTMVQDLGRSGFQQYGVAVAGAADAFAARLLNLLVANPESAAVLECTLTGPELFFPEETLIAWCGADFPVKLDGEPLPSNRPARVPARGMLAFGAARRGCRAWLAVAGGIDVPVVMGSRSTYLRVRLGGHEGRALAAGDVLPVGAPAPAAARLLERLRRSGQTTPTWRAALAEVALANPLVLRVVRGPEFGRFAPEAQAAVFAAEYRVTKEADRMGVRLEGPALALVEPRELFSAAVNTGVVQVPASGQPIVLLPSRQTVGGYPRIAAVIAVDFGRLAQLRPDVRVQFREVALAEAHALHLARERDLNRLALGLQRQYA